MKKLCSFSAVLLYCVIGLLVGANAQSSTPAPSATGKVVGPDAKPQVGVPIVVKGQKGTTTAFTDGKGEWSLYNLEPGKYAVGPAVTSNAPQVEFTVEGGSKQQATYHASEMKLDKDWNTGSR